MGRDIVPSSSLPTILEKTLVTAGVEEPQVLVSDGEIPIKKIMIKSRVITNALKFSWISGGNFMTIPANFIYWDDALDAWQLTVYLIGTVDGQIAEIMVWR